MARHTTTAQKRSNNEQSQTWIANGFDITMSFARLNGYAAQSMLRYNLELVDFLKHRLEQDLMAVNSLVSCRNADEAMDVSRKFMQSAVSEYSEKAGQLADISTKIATEAVEHVQEETSSFAETLTTREAA